MTTGQRIAYYRERAGLSQVELAEKIGITKQLLWKYENDHITNIPLENIALLADALHVDPAVLSGWKEEGEDEELLEYLEELRTRPEMKMLFDSSRHMSIDQVKAIVAMIEGFRNDSMQ